MGIIPSKKNKRYSYTPRYYKNDGEGSPFEMKHKFDDSRTTVGSQGGIRSRFNAVMDEMDKAPDKTVNKRIYIIIAVLVLLFLIFIDFDLSIFFPKR